MYRFSTPRTARSGSCARASSRSLVSKPQSRQVQGAYRSRQSCRYSGGTEREGARLRAGACPVGVDDKRVVDVHLDPVEGDDGLHRAARAAFFEREDADDLQLF